jgi:hypothetical protein
MFAFSLLQAGDPGLPGITMELEPVQCVGSIVDQVSTTPPATALLPWPAFTSWPESAPPHYVKTDSLISTLFIQYVAKTAIGSSRLGI